mgnify:FL=1
MIAPDRLANHHIGGATFAEPDAVVQWMGLIQAQDYLGALWAIGLRLPGVTEADIERALAARSIVRTWPARGTLHFVAAQDARWMLELLAPRVIARSRGRLQQVGLDEATLARSRQLFSAALQGGKQLTRAAMCQLLESAHISTAGQRGIYILGRLAQEGLLCFGAREGKQQTFTLLAEWVGPTEAKSRAEALAELARRYFTSHGPATVQDFVWWSGLTTADARAALEMAKPHLIQEALDEQAYWLSSSAPSAHEAPPTAYLLPAFDEYLVGYRDRSAVLEPAYARRTNNGGGILSPTILIAGRVVGVWKRTLKKGSVVITPDWFSAPTAAQEQAFGRAALHYGAFLGLPVTLADK